MESLPTLLGGAVVHVLRDAHPVVRALFTHQLNEKLILFRYPGSSTMCLGHCCYGVVWCGGVKIVREEG